MIEKYSFGEIVVEGETYTGDITIVDGNVVSNWWRKTGHKVEIDDISHIMKFKPDILVLGKGKPGLMKSSKSLKAFLKENNIELIEESSSKAVETFNRLMQEGKKVAAGFHLTC